MPLYDSIFKRKSVRKYQREPLPREQLARIMDFVSSMKPLHSQIGTHIELADPDDVKGMVSAKAPHYLLFYSETKAGHLENAGFLLQQADLFLSSEGLGSCWLGMAKVTAPAKNGMEYIIMLTFGKAQENPHRADASEFKRKPINEISKGADERLEAVRLAPSATNSQPWYYVCEEGDIFVYRRKLGIVKAAMYGVMNQIDMGIALCHLWLASERQERTFSFSTELPPGAPTVEGYTEVGAVC